MNNIKVTVSSTICKFYHPVKFICRIYGNDNLLSTTDHIPNIQLTMYIEKKIVLEFKEVPKVVILKYDAIILTIAEKKRVESKIVYNTGSIPVSDLKIYDTSNFTSVNKFDDIKFYRASCELSRMSYKGIGDNNNFI